jgi:histamine receptor H1
MLSIVNPLKYKSYQSKTKSKIAVLVVWLFSSLWLVPINFWHSAFELLYGHTSGLANEPLTNRTENEFKCMTDFETNLKFKIITTLFNFYVPLFGIILIYSKIFLTIVKRSRLEFGSFRCAHGMQKNRIRFVSTKRSAMSQFTGAPSTNDDRTYYSTPVSSRMSRSGTQTDKSSVNFEAKNSFLLKEISSLDGEKIESIKSDENEFFARNVPHKNTPLLRKKNKRPCKKEEYLQLRRRRNAIDANAFNSFKSYDFALYSVKSTRKKKRVSIKDKVSSRLKQQIKAAQQLGILLAAFLLTWLPYFVIFIVVAFCANCVSDNITVLTVWLGYFNSSLNPILYPLCNSAFKSTFRRILKIPSRRKDIHKLLNYRF